MFIELGAKSNRIGTDGNGTSDTEERNVISGNTEDGVSIEGSGTDNNIVAGNYIGTNASGATDLGNGSDGVFITDSASSNIIGSDGIGKNRDKEGNTIWYNNLFGVRIESGTGNRVLRNSISDNGGLGINLVGGNETGDGVTPNDENADLTFSFRDSDTGANNLQNFPVLTSAIVAGGNTTIGGALQSQADRTYRIDFYSSDKADGSGFGEGRTWLHSENLTVDGTGAGTFSYAHPAVIAQNHVITVTATDQTTHDTSEFSAYKILSGTLVDFLKSNNVINPVTEALNVSNYVTNDGTLLTPANTAWSTTNVDPDNFRLHVSDPVAYAASPASLAVTLDVIHNGVATSYSITLDDREAAGGVSSYRSPYIRLVTDTTDLGSVVVAGHTQTVLVQLGDTVRATYTDTTGTKHVKELGVGRPAGEQNNGTNQLRHDIRDLRLNIVVFRNNGNTAPAISRANLMTAIADTNERLAQANIRVVATTINMGGVGDPGVALPHAGIA